MRIYQNPNMLTSEELDRGVKVVSGKGLVAELLQFVTLSCTVVP